MSIHKGEVTSIFGHARRLARAEEASPPTRRGDEIQPLELGAPGRDYLVNEAKRIYDLRRIRSRYLPKDFFGEPAWDILLILYIEAGDRHLTATGAAQVTDAPETTALRWVETLERAGLIVSFTHASDRRLRLLSLSSNGRAMMDQYLAAILRN